MVTGFKRGSPEAIGPFASKLRGSNTFVQSTGKDSVGDRDMKPLEIIISMHLLYSGLKLHLLNCAIVDNKCKIGRVIIRDTPFGVRISELNK